MKPSKSGDEQIANALRQAEGGTGIAAVAAAARAHGLVVLAGAGLSMGPPSSLPGWTAINDAFLQVLALKVAEHADGDVPSFALAELIAQQRDAAGTGSPDLQAQFAEDSLGGAYFRLFEPLDIDAWNDGHAALAALAGSGTLRAVITTNFDRLIELACRKAGVAVDVFASPADFERLSLASTTGSALPIIKVHGSVDKHDTIVDTLRQRVLGRPAALERALTALFARHAVLVIGFSGADLAYDPYYLGLRQGAGASPMFAVLVRPGTEPRAEIRELAASAPHMRMVTGGLPDALRELLSALDVSSELVRPAWTGESDFPGTRAATLFSDAYTSLADAIDPVAATVALSAIAEIAGSADGALRLLRATMPHHARRGLLDAPAMSTQQSMMARHLIDRGLLHPSLTDAASDAGTATALDVLTLKDVRLGTEGMALQSLAFALCGDGVHADAAGLRALRESRQPGRPALRADVICTLAHGWTVQERWEASLREALRIEYDMMFHFGDEPRRLRIGAWYGRFLIEAGELDLAEQVIVDCQSASRRLSMAQLHNDLVALGGRLHLARGVGHDALRTLRSVYGHFERSEQLLRCSETLLPLREAAMAAGEDDLVATVQPVLARFLVMIPGLALPYAASQVRLSCQLQAWDAARKVVSDLRRLGKHWGDNVWVETLAQRLSVGIEGQAPSPTSDDGPTDTEMPRQ